MMYPHLSMYAPCIIHALRYFERDQFLFLRYEDLMRMDAASIVRLVGRFTGDATPVPSLAPQLFGRHPSNRTHHNTRPRHYTDYWGPPVVATRAQACHESTGR